MIIIYLFQLGYFGSDQLNFKKFAPLTLIWLTSAQVLLICVCYVRIEIMMNNKPYSWSVNISNNEQFGSKCAANINSNNTKL